MKNTEIKDLAVIGDQRTCALITSSGSVVFYCPQRFDNPALFAALLDEEKGGGIELQFKEKFTSTRSYQEDSAILKTAFSFGKDEMHVLDWMPINSRGQSGLIRNFSESPLPYSVKIKLAPDFCSEKVKTEKLDHHLEINETYYCYASHNFRIEEKEIYLHIPDGQKAYLFISDRKLDPEEIDLNKWKQETIQAWDEITSHITYHGPYEDEVAQSIRAIRLLTYGGTGGIIAAATTSLPEVIGGDRNYDYRYSWWRDTGMIVSALIRAGSDGQHDRSFMSFICDTAHLVPDFHKIPMFTVDKEIVPGARELDLKGYRNSRPVLEGNVAHRQLQLDSLGNILIAAKLIYSSYQTREHWETICGICDFLVENWKGKGHGMWEEQEQHHYTSGKVITAKGLEFIAEYSEDKEQKERWQKTAKKIRAFVQENCLTSYGAYAVYAGSEEVDISAVLFAVWGYTAVDDPAMQKTIERLEDFYCRDHLYWRHLVDFDSAKEGAFLAGTFWMAQYYIMLNKTKKAKKIIDAALNYATDLGFFSEEADPENGEMLGNFPQSFVHASFIGAVIDYKEKTGTDEKRLLSHEEVI